MDVLIVAQYANIPGEDSNCRFLELASMLANFPNVKVELLTSSFCHEKKQQHAFIKKDSDLYEFDVKHFYEPGYRNNVGFSRIYSHYIAGENLTKYLNQRKVPDVIYCAVPSLSVGYSVAKYVKKEQVKFILDIQDLWPEAFKMAFNIPIISDIVFYPMKLIADKIYSQADEIVGVSKTYCDRALMVNSKCKEGLSVFLGTNLKEFDNNAVNEENKVNIVLNSRKIKLAYCGTLGKSYDLITVFDALEIIENKIPNKLQFVIMGDGPRINEFMDYSKGKHLDVIFTGRLPYPKMCNLLSKCDINVNPIIGKSVASIINKHADYAASGKPVINTQISKEYRELVEEYDMGYNCKNGDATDVANKLEKLMTSNELRKSMGIKARKCAEEKFDRRNSYRDIISLILK